MKALIKVFYILFVFSAISSIAIADANIAGYFVVADPSEQGHNTSNGVEESGQAGSADISDDGFQGLTGAVVGTPERAGDEEQKAENPAETEIIERIFIKITLFFEWLL